MDSFIENIWLHLNDPMIRIVYPEKWNRENYALDLETEFYKTYKMQMISSKIKYTDYRIYKAKINEPEIGDVTTLIDPRCYLEEIKRKDNILGEIFKLCKRELDR